MDPTRICQDPACGVTLTEENSTGTSKSRKCNDCKKVNPVSRLSVRRNTTLPRKKSVESDTENDILEKPKTYRKDLTPFHKLYILSSQGNCCRGPGQGLCIDANGKTLYVCPFKINEGDMGLLKGDNIPTFDNTWYHEYDHIIPVSQGGGSEISNYQALCSTCHGTKTSYDKLPDDLRKVEGEPAYIILSSLSKSKC